jgi:hypothetical protein
MARSRPGLKLNFPFFTIACRFSSTKLQAFTWIFYSANSALSNVVFATKISKLILFQLSLSNFLDIQLLHASDHADRPVLAGFAFRVHAKWVREHAFLDSPTRSSFELTSMVFGFGEKSERIRLLWFFWVPRIEKRCSGCFWWIVVWHFRWVGNFELLCNVLSWNLDFLY